jgi:hypothetical protein
VQDVQAHGCHIFYGDTKHIDDDLMHQGALHLLAIAHTLLAPLSVLDIRGLSSLAGSFALETGEEHPSSFPLVQPSGKCSISGHVRPFASLGSRGRAGFD